MKDRFPRLYSLTLCSEKVISEVGEWVTLDNVESFKWKLLWRRELFEWEKELQQQLHSILSTAQWSKNGLDAKVWVLDDRLGYTVRSGYALLEREGNSKTKEVFRILRSLKVAPTTEILVWRVLWNKLPTRGNLVVRGVQLANTLCPLCNMSEETADHFS